MLITKHDKSYLVELSDGPRWRIWPGDLASTLQWLPTTEIELLEIQDDVCTHELFDQLSGSRVRVIEANSFWPIEVVQHYLRFG